jgi:hypothetical protein
MAREDEMKMRDELEGRGRGLLEALSRIERRDTWARITGDIPKGSLPPMKRRRFVAAATYLDQHLSELSILTEASPV